MKSGRRWGRRGRKSARAMQPTGGVFHRLRVTVSQFIESQRRDHLSERDTQLCGLIVHGVQEAGAIAAKRSERERRGGPSIQVAAVAVGRTGRPTSFQSCIEVGLIL